MEDRFEKIYSQGGIVSRLEIWLDKATGAQYLWRENGNCGGLTPLLDREGKPLLIDKEYP